MRKTLWLLLILVLFFVVYNYNTDLNEQYLFADYNAKKEYLVDAIQDETNSSESVEKVATEILKMPDSVWKQFFRNDGSIILTYDLPSEGIVGSFSMRAVGSYRIYVSPDYIEYALLHEFGHYMGYAKNVERDKRFEECLSEKEKAINGVLNNNTYFDESSEYFSEMTKRYFHNEIGNDDFHLFCSYIEELLSDF